MVSYNFAVHRASFARGVRSKTVARKGTTPFQTTEEAVDDDTHLLVVRGDVDMQNAADLRNAIEEASSEGKSRLVIDMSDVPFMDSSGLASLVGAQKSIRGDVRMIVICPENLRRIFEVTRLDTILTVVATLPEALIA